MIENLNQYRDKANGKTKQKILGCIFTEKFENFDFESCNNIFTPEIKSIMLASKVLKSNKNGIELIKTRKNTIPSDQNGVINIKFKIFSNSFFVVN